MTTPPLKLEKVSDDHYTWHAPSGTRFGFWLSDIDGLWEIGIGVGINADGGTVFNIFWVGDTFEGVSKGIWLWHADLADHGVNAQDVLFAPMDNLEEGRFVDVLDELNLEAPVRLVVEKLARTRPAMNLAQVIDAARSALSE